MYFRKRLLLSFLILYELPRFINGQEYLKELRAKDIKFRPDQDLPPVELPRSLYSSRSGRSKYFELNEEVGENDARRLISDRPTLMDIALESSAREGLNAMRRLYGIIEPDMIKNGHVLHDNHPAALLSRFSAPMVESSRREMAAYATLTAAKAFRKNYNLNSDLARQAHTQKVSLRRTALESLCPPRDAPTCMPASERYRTHDGTCNNKRRQRWGASQMPFSRFLPPEYGDGVDAVRKSSDGGPLSSSRFVSLLVHGARDGEAPLTLMLAQWGQLLDHDLTSTAQPRSINGSVPSCCGNKDFHPSCFPIKVPLDDPWLSSLKVRCLEFLRSAPAQRRDCVLSWREQTNQATSFIDASPIYSNSVKSSDNARVFRNGLLIFGRGNPTDDVCQRGAIANNCIRSGDGRSGEQPGLLALHHVWVGEHNHIAMRLSEMNLHWSDEKIYQETRRIIGAMFQHITYREFLPIVLGREVVKLFELELLNSGYFEGYNPKTNPGVANSFAAAAFRFGHSLVQNSYMRCDRFHNVLNNNVSLHEEFQRGDIGSVGSLHRLIRGMANQRALKRDEFITPELTNHLFQTPGFPFGLDLAAINIQRGRDHGVPPYAHWRVPCGLSAINTWEEFANVVGPESARRISHAYQNVNDIDLFVGGIAERPVVGGLVGPTFACIIAQQFSNSRKGDRFWYENAGFESSFTPAQLHAIRRVTLASVLCRSVGGGTFQPHIFLPPDMPQNERLPCGVGSLSEFDIDPWLEQDPFADQKPAPLQLQTPVPIQVLTRPPPPPRSPPPPRPPPTARPLPPALPPPTLAPHSHPAPSPPTFAPPVLDRIFEIVQGELDTNAPIPDSFLTDNKVGFLNRLPPATKHPLFIAQRPLQSSSSNSFHRVKNSTKINDKLDLKHKGISGHVTKEKPVPGVSNKLDKNSRKGPHRHSSIQTTTRRTIIVNNIPIELRNAGTDIRAGGTTVKTDDKLESRTEDLTLTTAITDIDSVGTSINAKNLAANQMGLEARTEDIDIPEPKIQTELRSQTNEPNTTDAKLKPETDDKLEHQKSNDQKVTDNSVIWNKNKANINGPLNEKHPQGPDFTTTRSDKNENPSKTETEQSTAQSKDKPDFNKTQRYDLGTDTTEIKTDTTTDNKQNIELTSGNQPKLTHVSTTVTDEIEEDIITDKSNTKETGNLGISLLEQLATVSKNLKTNDNTTPTNTLNINDSDIDPLANSPSVEHRRVQRKLTLPSVIELHKDKLKFSPLKAVAKANISLSLPVHNKTLTTRLPKPTRTTVRNVELRQYQKRPSYPKPHKVIVDSVNGDNQYEIEINIRQTNQRPNPLESTPEYTTNYKTKPYDRYTGNNYATFTSTTPLYGYFQQSPTQAAQVPNHNERTKPPTVIFLSEHDEHRTTTRRPGFVHSIVGWSSGGQNPLPADIEPNERPGYDGVLSRPILPPSYQNARPGTVTSYSQAHLTGGVVQASSQAVSNGQYGTITGFASANGADSTFSFNIRPKPDKTQINRPQGLGNYGVVQPPPKTWYNQKPDYGEHNPSYDVPYRESVQSPFSGSNSQTYYIRKKTRPQQKEDLTVYRNPEIIDYDYLGRHRKPLHNITALEDTDTVDEDYEYDEDYGNSPMLRKFNKDGYLRPEHMIATLLESHNGTLDKPILPELPTTANQTLDDNYVLPAMNSTKDIPKSNLTSFPTDFPDSQSKQLNNDIFAEDLQENEDSTDDDSLETDKTTTLLELQHKRINILKRTQEKIAFAPITVLTKPERPDNWVIYDSPKEGEPLLPQIPDLNMDFSPSAEIPKPIRENIWLSLVNIKRKLAFKISNDTDLSLPSKTSDRTVQTNPDPDTDTDTDTDRNSNSTIQITEFQDIETTLDPNLKTTTELREIERTDSITATTETIDVTSDD